MVATPLQTGNRRSALIAGMERDYFKEEFKRYKKRSADLREVLDARDPQQAKNFTGTRTE